jgi:hypothetical protein
MELDHLFCFVEPDGAAIAALETQGLAVSYRRDHIGQGTANACFVFDNAFLELLWLTDAADACSPAIARTKLWERSQWQNQNTCPYGLAWRGDQTDIETWAFMPLYLPEGVAIPVACESDDPRLPMMFTFPGSTAPRDWPAVRRNFAPHPGGWNRLDLVELTLASHAPSSQALTSLSTTMVPALSIESSSHYALKVTLGRDDGAQLHIAL